MNETEILKKFAANRRESAELVNALTDLWKGRRVILLRGKYTGRAAEIQRAYDGWSCEYPMLEIFILRNDNKEGFKGKERFIDDHANEYVRLEEVNFLGEIDNDR